MTSQGSLGIGRSSPPSNLKSNNSRYGFNAISITVLSYCLRDLAYPHNKGHMAGNACAITLMLISKSEYALTGI